MSDLGKQRVGAVFSDHSIASIVGSRMSTVLVEPIIISIKAKIIFISVSVMLIICVVVGIVLALVYVFTHPLIFAESNALGVSCDDNPCQHGGICVPLEMPAFNVCVCAHGYGGNKCEINKADCSQTTCSNGGWCNQTVIDLSGDTVNRCVCPQQDAGLFCQFQNPCLSQPCQNGGTCLVQVTSTDAQFQCFCPFGTIGPTCSGNDTTIQTCAVNVCGLGSCYVNSSASRQELCICPPYLTGPRCAQTVNWCASRPCRGNSSCINLDLAYLCICHPGLTGAKCDQVTNMCLSRAVVCPSSFMCVDTPGSYVCQCLPGWTGSDCKTDIDECINNLCNSAGVCTNGCNGAGTCTNSAGSFTCSCNAGFTGSACVSNMDTCASSPCSLGATCDSYPSTYVCTCPPGVTGTLCDQDIDYCASNPCTSGATCFNIPSYQVFSCMCPDSSGYCQVDQDTTLDSSTNTISATLR